MTTTHHTPWTRAVMIALLIDSLAALAACQPHVSQSMKNADTHDTVIASGLLSYPSPHDVVSTVERLKAGLESRKLHLFNHIDHAKGAARIGQALRPTQLLIFGNPKGGTPLMQCEQRIAIELPLKTLVWENANGQVMVSMQDMNTLVERHGISDCSVVEKIVGMLDGLVQEVTAP